MIIPCLLAGNEKRIYLTSKAYHLINIISIIIFHIMEYPYFNKNKKPPHFTIHEVSSPTF